MKLTAVSIFTFAMAFGLFTAPVRAQADQRSEARIEKTFAFPVSTLEKIEQAMADAAARRGDAMKQEVRYEIDANDHSSVRCVEDSPTMYEGHLYGCVLEYVIDLGNGTTATTGAMLYITQSSAEVKKVLASTDQQKTSRVQLKTIFDGGKGSSFYCDAAGAQGWNCFLHLID